MTHCTAVVLAGSRPGVDPFATAYGTDLKALIPVGGVPMVRRPVEALLKSASVGSIRVLAQQPERIAEAAPKDERVVVARSGETIASTRYVQTLTCSGRSWSPLRTTRFWHPT